MAPLSREKGCGRLNCRAIRIVFLNGYEKVAGRFTSSFDRIGNCPTPLPHTPWFREYWGLLF